MHIYIYIKNKTFIIRSYISVSSKPSKTQRLKDSNLRRLFEGLEETEI